MSGLDKRLNAIRPDLADMRLAELVSATKFVSGRLMQICDPVADIRREPRPDAPVDSQGLYGEKVLVFEDHEGWCWVQLQTDGYVGYMAHNALTSRLTNATHIVSAPRTFLYPGPDMKYPVSAALSMGTGLSVTSETETRGTKYLALTSGEYIIAAHTIAAGNGPNDPVAVASRLLETPYLWGGRSGFGIDCSGLVQLSHALCGRSLQRDSDMLREGAGTLIGQGADHPPLIRGDLVFWKGHVAMMEDETMMIHASGHTMSVVREGFADAVQRIEPMYGLPLAYRRIAA
jgi:cell wall-associated NlpC family hydrolase